jgi:hypothetical protein
MPLVRDTITDTLAILRFNLENALNDLQPLPDNGDNDAVVISNIAFLDSSVSINPALDKKIVITLIKTEEEYAMKNRPAHRRNPVTNNIEYANPPVFLNLYLLIVPNINDYGTALTFLSRVISFFQHQRVFTEKNSAIPSEGGEEFPIQHFNFNLSMVSPSFEQLNHLWGILGGKLLPSVLYKLQLQVIEYIPDEPRIGDPIRQIIVNEQIT